MEVTVLIDDPTDRDRAAERAWRLGAGLLVAALVGAAPGVVVAEDPEIRAVAGSGTDAPAAGDVRAPQSGPDGEVARAFFGRLTELAGDWRAVSDKGWSEVITYEVIARGSVVMATTAFRDAPHRTMVTMYHMDGDRLVATHYCEARNQPRLVAEEIDLERGRAVFRFDGGGNLEDRDRGHMDQAVIRIVNDDHVRSRWTWYEDDSARWLEEIELERQR